MTSRGRQAALAFAAVSVWVGATLWAKPEATPTPTPPPEAAAAPPEATSRARFSVQVEAATMADPAQAAEVLEGVEVLLNSGAAGIQMVSQAAWMAQKSLKVAVDLNAVPPLGLEGVEVNDAGQQRHGVVCYGAFGVGNFKTKLHKRCVASLFEKNGLVLDAEAIADIARAIKK